MRIAGSWTIARPFGVPIRIHWSVPVCALLAGGIRYAPGAWLAFLLLVLVHEAGHAFVVRRTGARVTSLEILGIGGLCQWEGSVTPLQRACIAWGGVWAQMVVLLAAGLGVLLLGRPGHWFAAQMVDVALVSNLWLIGLNLLPIRPLDGHEAWALFPLLRRRFARRRRSVLVLPRSSLPQGHRPPAPAARDAGVAFRVAAPPPPSAAHRAGELDELDYTPEVLDVLERTRAIARDAARDPTQADRLAGRDHRGDGEP